MTLYEWFKKPVFASNELAAGGVQGGVPLTPLQSNVASYAANQENQKYEGVQTTGFWGNETAMGGVTSNWISLTEEQQTDVLKQIDDTRQAAERERSLLNPATKPFTDQYNKMLEWLERNKTSMEMSVAKWALIGFTVIILVRKIDRF